MNVTHVYRCTAGSSKSSMLMLARALYPNYQCLGVGIGLEEGLGRERHRKDIGKSMFRNLRCLMIRFSLNEVVFENLARGAAGVSKFAGTNRPASALVGRIVIHPKASRLPRKAAWGVWWDWIGWPPETEV